MFECLVQVPRVPLSFSGSVPTVLGMVWYGMGGGGVVVPRERMDGIARVAVNRWDRSAEALTRV